MRACVVVTGAACGDFDPAVAPPALRPGAVLLGRMDVGLRERTGARKLPGRIAVEVNGEPRDLLLAPDRSFNVKELPAGPLDLTFGLAEATGRLVLDLVEHGEVIEVLISPRAASLEVTLLSRETHVFTYNVPPKANSTLVIPDNHVVFFVEPGGFAGALQVFGSDVRVFSRNHDEPCRTRPRTIFFGDLIVLGDRFEAYDVSVRGRVIVSGRQVRLDSPCEGVWRADGRGFQAD